MLLSSAACATGMVATAAMAVDLSWDGRGQTPLSGGPGIWNTTLLRWWDGAGFVAWNNATNDNAVFTATRGSVQARSPVTFGGLSFQTDMLLTAAAGSGYTWGTTSPSLNVGAGVVGTVFPSITGAAGQTLTVSGGGTFRFFSAIGAVSTINLASGTLAYAGALADIAAATRLDISSGATFEMGFVNDAFGSVSGSGTIRMSTFPNLGIVTGPLLTLGGDGSSSTFAGSIIGAGGRLTKTGNGELTLNGNNSTMSGQVLITGGTLRVGGGSALSDESFVGLTAAAAGNPAVTLALNANERIGSIGSNAGAAGTEPRINLGSFDLTVSGSYASTQFNGIIEGTGRLIKVGGGIQQLTTAANLSTYSGGTVIRDGILLASADRKLGAVPVSPTLNITLDGGVLSTFSTTGYTLDANRQIEVTSNNGGILVAQDGTTTRTLSYGGVVSGAGQLTKTGPGTLAFVQQGAIPLVSHTYTGGTVIREGALTSALATTGTAGTPLGSGNVTLSNSTLSFLPTAGAGDVLLAVATDAGRTFNYGPGSNLTIGRNTNTSVQLTIGPSGALASSLVRGPQGTLVITPTNGIAELGLPSSGIRVLVNGDVPNANGGVPAINGDMVSGSIVSTTGISDFTGEFVRYGNTDGFMQALYSVQPDLNFSTPNDVFNATTSQVVAGSASAYALNVRSGVTVSGAGGVSVGSGSGAAGVILNGATISTSTLGFGGAQGVLYAGGTAAGTVSRINSDITGSGGIAKVGNGVLELGFTGTLGYTGPTHVAGGTLRLTSNNQLPSSSDIILGGAATLDFNGTSQSVASISSTQAFTNAIALGSAGRVTVGSGDSTFLGIISGAVGGTSTLEKNGSGVLTLGYPVSSAGILSSTNTYNKLVVKGGGIVSVSRNESLGAIPAANVDPTLPGLQDAITLDGGTLRWTGLATATTTAGNSNAISNQRGMVIGPNGATIDVTEPLEILIYQRGNDEAAATNARNLITSADSGNPGVITKTGPGFFRLGVGNTFLGKWVVKEGNLQFQADSALGTEPAVFTPDALTLDGGMIQVAGTSTGTLSPNRGVTVTSNGGSIQGFIFNGAITGPGTIRKVAATTATMNAPSPTWTGGMVMSNGSVNLNADNAAGTGPITFDTSNFVKTIGKTVAGDVTLPNNIVLQDGGMADFRFASGRMNLTGNISGPADWGKGVTGASAGTLALGGSGSSFGGVFTITDGTVVVIGAQALGSTAGGTVVNPGATLGFENVNYALAEPTYIAGTGVGGAGAIVNFAGDNTFPGNITATQDATIAVPSGNLVVGNVNGASQVTKIGSGRLSAAHFRTNELNVSEATVQVTQKSLPLDPSGTSRVNVLTIAGGTTPTATLDVTNNAFVVDYPTSDAEPFDTIRAQIVNAYNGGAWNQPGITSSLATSGTYGVGYAEASALSSVPAFFGPVDSTAVLFTYTRYGDADLNGVVNLGDFNLVAANFGLVSGAVWSQGDFDYNGNVNLGDFNLLAANFGLSAAPGGPTPEDWAALASVVPEPSSMLVVGAGVLSLLRRRRV